LVESVSAAGGKVVFIELVCAAETVLKRLSEDSRTKFGKLTDPALYRQLEKGGAFEFPALPAALIRIDTDESSPDESARKIQNAIELYG